MALIINNSVAICSLGLSCQTAMQLYANQKSIQLQMKCELVSFRTPFDYLISSPFGISRMIKEGKFFPDKVEQFNFKKSNYWEEMNCLYIHEKIQNRFSELIPKWNHISSNFLRLSNYNKKIFIISNTQNNLYEFVKDKLDDECLLISDNGIASIRNSLESRFGDVELHCVVYEDRNNLTKSALIDGLHVLAKDTSKVRGDTVAWLNVFSEILF